MNIIKGEKNQTNVSKSHNADHVIKCILNQADDSNRIVTGMYRGHIFDCNFTTPRPRQELSDVKENNLHFS